MQFTKLLLLELSVCTMPLSLLLDCPYMHLEWIILHVHADLTILWTQMEHLYRRWWTIIERQAKQHPMPSGSVRW